MKYSKLGSQIAGFALAVIGFTACKKNEIIQPDAIAPVDSIQALRMRQTGGTGTGTGAANTFYVSTTGNDATGTGTISLPWKTLAKATTAVTTSGSTIHVNAGTYLETASLSLAVGVNLEGADSSTTIIKSTVGADYTPLMNVSSAVGTNGNQSISKLKFDGQL